MEMGAENGGRDNALGWAARPSLEEAMVSNMLLGREGDRRERKKLGH